LLAAIPLLVAQASYAAPDEDALPRSTQQAYAAGPWQAAADLYSRLVPQHPDGNDLWRLGRADLALGRDQFAALEAERIGHPCADDPHHRAFDFWVGDWDVFSGGLARVTWTANPDGSVHRFIQRSADGGTTWKTYFDALYRDRPPAAQHARRAPAARVDPARAN